MSLTWLIEYGYTMQKRRKSSIKRSSSTHAAAFWKRDTQPKPCTHVEAGHRVSAGVGHRISQREVAGPSHACSG